MNSTSFLLTLLLIAVAFGNYLKTPVEAQSKVVIPIFLDYWYIYVIIIVVILIIYCFKKACE